MARGHIGDKPLFESMLTYCQLDHWEQILVKLETSTTVFIQENEIENILCNIASILFQPVHVSKVYIPPVLL